MESVDVILTLTPDTLLCDEYVNVEVVIASLCEGAQEDLYQYESAVNVSTGEVQILSHARTTPVNDTAKFDVSWQPHCLYPGSESPTGPIPADGLSAGASVQSRIPQNMDGKELLTPPSPLHRTLAGFSESRGPHTHYSHLASTVTLSLLLLAGLATLILKYYKRRVEVNA
jgi:hypothetical protein